MSYPNIDALRADRKDHSVETPRMFSVAAATPRSRSLFIPTSVELWSLSALIAFYWLADEIVGDASDDLVNIAGPIAFSAIMGFGLVRMLLDDARSIFAPLFTFRVASAVYFGMGSLVHMVVSPERRAILESFYLFTDRDVAKLNFLVACSTLFILVVAGVAESFATRSETPAPTTSIAGADARRMRNYGLVFLVIGSALKYIFVFPVSIGWVAWGEVPGSIVTMAEMSLIGLNLLTIWSLQNARAFFPIVCVLVAIEMLVGVLLLSKTQVLLPMLMLLVGIMAQRLTLKRVIGALIAVAIALEVLQPMIAFARDEFNLRTGGMATNATIAMRAQILVSYFDPFRTRSPSEEPGEGLMRISYVNAGAFAIVMYDRGNSGDSFKNLFVSLVPRVLWPEKPLLQAGGDFAMAASGRYVENSVSPGMFAEAYWNYGWMGVPLVMTPLGLFLLWMSRYSLWVLQREKWMFFPIALIGMKVGLAIDGMFVSQIAGTTAIVVVFHVVTVALEVGMQRIGFGALHRA